MDILHPGRLTAGSPTNHPVFCLRKMIWTKPPWLCFMLISRGVFESKWFWKHVQTTHYLCVLKIYSITEQNVRIKFIHTTSKFIHYKCQPRKKKEKTNVASAACLLQGQGSQGVWGNVVPGAWRHDPAVMVEILPLSSPQSPRFIILVVQESYAIHTLVIHNCSKG